jgi:hypothetical protein
MSFTLIETQTASDDTNLDFLTGITTDCSTYMLIVTNFSSTTTSNPAFFIAQLSEDGGETFIDEGYFSFLSVGSGWCLSLPFNNTSTLSTKATFYNLTNASGNKLVSCDGGIYTQDFGAFTPNTVASMFTPPNVANALRLKIDDGSEFTATVSLYSLDQ